MVAGMIQIELQHSAQQSEAAHRWLKEQGLERFDDTNNWPTVVDRVYAFGYLWSWDNKRYACYEFPESEHKLAILFKVSCG